MISRADSFSMSSRKWLHYLGITLGVAALHRVLVFGISFLGSAFVMMAWGESWLANLSVLATPTIVLAGVLDFPAIVAGCIAKWSQGDGFPLSEALFESCSVAQLPGLYFWQGGWSLCVGAITVALFHCLRKLMYHGRPHSRR